MTDVVEHTHAACPMHRAPALLTAYLRGLEEAGDGLARISLEVPLPGGAGSIVERVQARFGPLIDTPVHAHTASIEWWPGEGRPFPSFHGTLAIEAAEDYDSCRLTVKGVYQPPLGKLGAAFDSVVGKRIAQVTLKTLLDHVRGALEAAHQSETAAKKG
jgi:hypothetical protein